MNWLARFLLAAAGIAAFTLGAALLLSEPWAAAFSPWPLSRLSEIFLASIMAAIGAPLIGIAISGELAAVAAGALNLFVVNLGIAVTCFANADGTPAGRPVLYLALCATVVAVLMACIGFWSLRQPFHDRRPLPWLARVAFAGFAVILIAVGVALVRARPNTFPWPLPPQLSAVYGWIFLGAACYFACAVLIPIWGNAKGQMLGFLAYDLVLIGPYAEHFLSVAPAMLPSLIIYVAVIVLSGILCFYYIFVSRDASPFGWDVLELEPDGWGEKSGGAHQPGVQ